MATNIPGMAAAVLTAPKRWIVNIIGLQEKKEYSFYVILLFACFVGITRFMLESILAHRIPVVLNLSVVNSVTFYLESIFIYTLVLTIFIPDQSWRKSINIVLVGVFLGIFPPVIDVWIYGLGNFHYEYSLDFLRDWRLLLYNEGVDITLGETLTLFMTIFFTSLVVYIKTRKIIRTILSFVVTYGFVVFYSQILSTIAFKMAPAVSMPGIRFSHEFGFNIKELFFVGGFSYLCILNMLQLLTVLIIYLLINRAIALNILKRLNHAVPAGLTTLMGYTLLRSLDGFAVITALFFTFTFVVAIIQNDYFDRVEDEVEGRAPYLERNDVSFFNTILLFLAGILIFSGNIVGYLLLLFVVVSFLYNYDFYRAKRYFPSNNKIEGIAGVSSFLGGVSMAFIVNTGISGDILNMENVVLSQASGAIQSIEQSVRELWSIENSVITFLVFGGWFVVSIFKDYKDIRGDAAARNQTVYTLLQKGGRDVNLFHRIFSLVVFFLLLIPAVWFGFSRSLPAVSVCLGIIDLLLLFALTRKDAKKAVTLGFVMLNAYLVCIIVGNHIFRASLQ